MSGWTNGLNTISNPYLVEQNESRDCLNVVSTERGAIRKRYGSEQFLKGAELAKVSAVTLTTMFPCLISGTRYLIVAGGGKIWSVTMAGVVAEIGKGFNATARWSIVQAPKSTAVGSQGPIYLVNGVDAPQTWTGTGEVKEWKGLGSAQKPKDGEIVAHTNLLKSAEAKFFESDIGLWVEFAAEQTVLGEGGTEVKIKRAEIEAITPTHEAVLALPGENGWKETKATLEFTLERNFYEKGEHVPNGQYMIFFGNRIWMTGIKEDQSAVWFSELTSIGEGGAQADPSQWPNTNVARFDASDENPIMAIGHVGPYILVFKEEKLWAIHDINTGANRRISTSIGCIAHRSVVESPHGTFFLTKDSGVYLTNGSTVTEMSYLVRPTILGLNPAQRENVAGVYFDNHYYVSFASATSSENNKTLDYDLVLKSWWLHDLAGPCWALQEPSSGKETLFLLPKGSGKGIAEAFKEGIYTDLGSNYTGNGLMGAYFLTNWESFAYYIFRHRVHAPFLKKRIRQIFFNGEGQIVPAVFKDFTQSETQLAAVVGNEEQYNVKVPTNFASGAESWAEGEGRWAKEVEGAEATWGGETEVGQARIYSPGVAFNWSVGWGNNSAEPFVVDSFTYFAQFRKS
jgi:hypothetical protein